MSGPKAQDADGKDRASLIGRAVARPVATLMFTLMVVVVGVIGALRLSVDLLPEFEFPTVTVFAPYPGVGSVEMESLVLERLEDAVASVPGLERMTGRAREGAAVLFLQYVFGSDLLEAMNDVRIAVERARQMLPDDIEAPSVFRFDPTQFPILFISVAADKDLREITRICRDELKPRLSRVAGVAAVDLRGAFEREVRVELRAAHMLDLEITIDQVIRALAEENVDVSGGKMMEGGREVGVRTVSSKRTPEALLQIPVAEKDGRAVLLADIARVVDGTSEAQNISRVMGKTAIRLGVRKADGENTIEVAERVRAEMEKLRKDYPDLEFETSADQSKYIQRAVDGAKNAAIVGGLLAIAVLLLFLRSFRATFLVAVAIPVSVLSAFVAMERLDVSLNLMTLGGLALGVGMLVDNAVVVLESIVHRLQRGERGERAAVKGANEVALAVAASTATTLVIFIPVLFLEGINRVIYGQLALVVVVSLIASLVVALTLVPSFAGRLFASGFALEKGRIMLATEEIYGRILRAALARPVVTLMALVGVGLFAAALIPRVETELMPATDEGQINVNLELPVGTPIEETDAIARELSEIVRVTVPEASRVWTNVGPPGWWSSATGEVASISLELPELAARPRDTADVVKALETALPKVPGAKVGVRSGGGFFLLRMIRGGSGEDRLEVQVRGVDLEAMGKYAEKVSELMKSIEGVRDVRLPQTRGRDEVAVSVRVDKAASFGLSSEAVGRAVETYVRGRRATVLRTVSEDIPVFVRLAPEDREHTEQLRALLVRAPKSGAAVALGEVADLVQQEGPLVIQREEGMRVLDLGAEVSGRPLGEIADEIRARLSELEAPPGVSAMLRGEAAAKDDLFDALAFGGLLALLLVYMVMAAQFESLVQPLLVMGAVPFAGVGVLLLFGTKLATLNLYSFMGMIVLVGIVVNNAIVLVDYAGQLRRDEGLRVEEALVVATRRRLRPILMTTMTTLLGLSPVALSQAEGSELQGPLARVVVSGLLTSSLVTLILVPVLYSLVEGALERRRGLASR